MSDIRREQSGDWVRSPGERPGCRAPEIVSRLGGPVFALIEQPTYGWGDPLVLIPLLAGSACLAAFIWREATARAPMLPLALFRVRNFAVANAATLATYAGLIGSSFFLTLYLQRKGKPMWVTGLPALFLCFVTGAGLCSQILGELRAPAGPAWAVLLPASVLLALAAAILFEGVRALLRGRHGAPGGEEA